MFQGLKSHKLEFADKLVRSNKKGPLQSLQPITYVPLSSISRVKSFPFDCNFGFLTGGSPEIDGMAPSVANVICLLGELSGVI